MKLRKTIIITLISLMFVFSLFSVSAQESYSTFNYTISGSETASPPIFEVERTIYGSHYSCGSFNEAMDIFVDAQDRLYLLDSGNARVLLFDKNFTLERVISDFYYEGKTIQLATGASGIFYQDVTDQLYITDTANNRILVSDRNGKITHIWNKPQSELLDPSTEYLPSKIIVDNSNNMYVLSKNINTGALLLDANNNFVSFFGINKVQETALMKAERFWSKLFSGNSESGDYSFQPVEYNNLFWGNDRFVYAVSTRNEYLSSEVVKLNALGNNILKTTDFADLLDDSERVEVIDITVEDNGFFTILDRYNGKLYNYDSEGELIGAYGGIGQQEGLFKSPCAIESMSDGRLIVLDADKNNMTVFKPTYYACLVRQAVLLFQDGCYIESLEPWQEVLKINSNFSLAYIGMGKANMMLGNYEKAKQQFENGGDKVNYSLAKQAARDNLLKQNFTIIAFLVFAFGVFIVFLDKIVAFIKLFILKAGRRQKR